MVGSSTADHAFLRSGASLSISEIHNLKPIKMTNKKPAVLKCCLAASVFVLLSGAVRTDVASAQDVSVNQNSKLNLSVIQLENARGSTIDVEQQGVKNLSIAVQVDTVPEGWFIESADYDDFAKHSLEQKGVFNFGVSVQDTQLNMSGIVQMATGDPPRTHRSQNSLTISDIGDDNILVHFKSGEVDILTINGPGGSAMSRFGRRH
jgi:hypothetical protein